MSPYITLEVQPQAAALFEKHKPTIDKAIEALNAREFYAHYPEHDKAYGDEARTAGLERYQNQLNNAFDRLIQDHDTHVASDEVSPYTLENLGISYPAFSDPKQYIERAGHALKQWRNTTPQLRAALLVEALEQIRDQFFEIAFATMHTSGQGYMMSFQASGPHANDRALEAIALGYKELTSIPAQANWEKPMGKVTARLQKYYKAVPRGVALAIGCSTFPIWNSMPGVFASLITGNPVIMKPHPRAIYPMSIVVATIQHLLKEHGLNPHVIQIAADTEASPLTKVLAEMPEVKIIDYTGGSAFGEYVESLPGKITFTEKAGVNSVIIDSTNDLGEMAKNLAFSVSLYSGQMCTAPQNFFIPKSGIRVGNEVVPYEKVVEALAEAVKGLVTHPKAGPAVCGAVQSEKTQTRVEEAKKLKAKPILESIKIDNPEFPKARTAGPSIYEVEDRSLIEQEMFGPILFVVPTENTEESLQLAKDLAQHHGAISCAAYTTDDQKMNSIAEEMAEAFTPVSFNLTGQVFVNQNAGFSDFHVSGGNPAGNASFTDAAFVVKRFVLVGAKVNEN